MAFYDNVDTEQKHRLGTRKKAQDGREFIYLSVAVDISEDDAVSYAGGDFTVALVDTDVAATINRAMAITMVTFDYTAPTTLYGWFGIFGEFVCDAAAVVAGANVYATSTAGRLDDAAASIGRVHGAVWASIDSSATNLADIYIQYPFIGPDLSA